MREDSTSSIARPHEYATTLSDLLAHWATSAPDTVAVSMVDSGETLSYAEMAGRSERAAVALERLGLRRGDAMALWLPNGIDWLVLFLAGARLGLLVVPLNTRYHSAEVAHLLSLSKARVLFIQPGFHSLDFAGMTAEALAQEGTVVQKVVLVGEGDPAPLDSLPGDGPEILPWEQLWMQAERAKRAESVGRPDDPVIVFGTSGTTSFPKLAVHNQAGVCRHVTNLMHAMRLGTNDRALLLMPFCGTYGFVTALATLVAGGTAVVLPVYKERAVMAAIDNEAITCTFLTEANARQLLAEEISGGRPGRYRAWTKSCVAGFKIRDLVDLADEALGVKIVNAYGSSELFAMMAIWRLDDDPEYRALPGGRILDPEMHVRVVDPITREPVQDGESGELEFSGFYVTRGYLGNDEANARAFSEDGWYRSGDRGRILGDRVIELESRISDILRLRGYLVSPAEIEELLLTSPQVHAAQVVGIPDPSTGEDLAIAFVITAPGTDHDELRAHCRERAASWKVPARFVEVTEFPVTPSANGDKVQKGKLREHAMQLLGQEQAGTDS